jgi:hypothetical protein
MNLLYPQILDFQGAYLFVALAVDVWNKSSVEGSTTLIAHYCSGHHCVF